MVVTERAHILKCWPKYFRAIVNGRKTFEVRYNDRAYRIGDTLVLEEWVPLQGVRTGQSYTATVVYILDHTDECAQGLRPGYVVPGLAWGEHHAAPEL